MPNHADFPPLQVALLALPETTPTTLHAFLEVFSGVGVAWGEVTGRPVSARRVEARIAARSTTPFRSPVGPLIAPDVALEVAERPELIVVTDLALPSDGPVPGAWTA